MVSLAIHAKAVLARQAEEIVFLVLHVAHFAQRTAFFHGVRSPVHEVLIKLSYEWLLRLGVFLVIILRVFRVLCLDQLH